MVTTASHLSGTGTCNNNLDTLLAPNILWIAANLAAPCSHPKYGAKIQSGTHLRRKNLHAPQGEPELEPGPELELAMPRDIDNAKHKEMRETVVPGLRRRRQLASYHHIEAL